MKRLVSKFSTRKLLKPEGNEVSYLQLLGFALILAGILVMFISLCHDSPSRISISFFITMLGVAFAFPSLLEGNEGLSTMRIVVFMMTNVICLLLLKIGWDKHSLGEIGLDEWWMGVIAFVFGAKATQTYFESKMAVPSGNSGKELIVKTYAHAEIAGAAVAQNEADLKGKFKNINAVSSAVNDLGKAESHVVAIYLKDNNTAEIPSSLKVKMDDGFTRVIATQVVAGGGDATAHISNGDTIAGASSPDDIGSICCGVKLVADPAITGIVTAAHVYTKGKYDETYNGFLPVESQQDVLFNGKKTGKWHYKQLNGAQDLAVIRLNGGNLEDHAGLKRFYNLCHEVTDADVHAQVTVLSRNDNERQAYILDHGIGYPVKYNGTAYYKTGIILIGSVADRLRSRPVSDPGDSGGCVYIQKDGKDHLVGVLLGGDANFTFVLPLKSALSPLFEIF